MLIKFISDDNNHTLQIEEATVRDIKIATGNFIKETYEALNEQGKDLGTSYKEFIRGVIAIIDILCGEKENK